MTHKAICRPAGLLTGCHTSLPHRPLCTTELPPWQVTSLKESKEESKKGRERRKPGSLCDLLLETTPCHFYCVLCVRRESQDAVQPQGKRITWGNGQQEPPQCSKDTRYDPLLLRCFPYAYMESTHIYKRITSEAVHELCSQWVAEEFMGRSSPG